MFDNGRRTRRSERVSRLHAQADRARKMAVECGSALIADLFEVHAQMCERNAKAPPQKKTFLKASHPLRVTSKRPVIVAVRDGSF
jgi:hypothetical protein